MKLTSRLRHASHDLHAVAEKSGLMPLLLRGQLSHTEYAVYLRNLQAIYAALEQGLTDAERTPELDFAPLLRSNAIAEDLAFLGAPADAPLTAATGDYVRRLQALGAAHSPLLLAHAYLRYLGDLHGGQIMRRCVGRMLQCDGTDGLHFYDFGTPERVAALIDAFRSGLDQLPLDEPQAQAMADEARLGFGLHIDVFTQLPYTAARAA
jgi:heme oxygenase